MSPSGKTGFFVKFVGALVVVVVIYLVGSLVHGDRFLSDVAALRATDTTIVVPRNAPPADSDGAVAAAEAQRARAARELMEVKVNRAASRIESLEAKIETVKAAQQRAQTESLQHLKEKQTIGHSSATDAKFKAAEAERPLMQAWVRADAALETKIAQLEAHRSANAEVLKGIQEALANAEQALAKRTAQDAKAATGPAAEPPTELAAEPASDAAAVGLAGAASAAERASGDRSFDFDWLAGVLNRNPQLLVQQKGQSKGASPIHTELKEWMTTRSPLKLDAASRKIEVDCAQARYKGALSGKRGAQDRFIVDFVPVGFDLDVVELRLFEEWQAVDVFVLYEAVYSHNGDEKPLYLNESMAVSTRWKQFESKILHLIGTPERLRTYREKTFAVLRQGKIPWELEHYMRHDPKLLLQDSDHPLAKLVMQHVRDPRAVAMQNDGDEITAGSALLHMKVCEEKGPAPYYMPAVTYKGGAGYLFKTKDMAWLISKWQRTGVPFPAGLGQYLWKPGPTVNTLAKAIHMDLGQGRYGASANWPDFGPGAAVHMSSSADPVQQWLKHMSVVEAKKVIPKALLDAASKSKVDRAIIGDNLHDEGTSPENFCTSHHVSTIDLPMRTFLEMSLPWPLAAAPARYPCLTTETFHTTRKCGETCCHPKCF